MELRADAAIRRIELPRPGRPVLATAAYELNRWAQRADPLSFASKEFRFNLAGMHRSGRSGWRLDRALPKQSGSGVTLTLTSLDDQVEVGRRASFPPFAGGDCDAMVSVHDMRRDTILVLDSPAASLGIRAAESPDGASIAVHLCDSNGTSPPAMLLPGGRLVAPPILTGLHLGAPNEPQPI